MIRFFMLCVIILGCAKNTCEAQCIEIYSIYEVSSDLLYAPKNPWIIVDLDDVVFEGQEALTHTLWLEATIKGFKELGVCEQEAWKISYPCWIEFQERGSVKLIESCFRDLFSELAKNNHTVFIYTERSSSEKDLTLRQLDSLGIHVPHPQISFLSQPDAFEFCSGVLFGGERHKGPALQHFLDSVDNLPSKIIYIDNNANNVLRIADLCKSRHIPFLGITYLAQKLHPPVYQPDIAKTQYTFAQKLLSNEAAALLLRHQLNN